MSNMSTFGPIAYEDMALLNAQWQQARPAVHGLGFMPSDVDAEYVRRICAGGRCKPMHGLGDAHFGQHDYRDVSYLNARLRPIFPAEVGMPPPSTASPGWGAGSLGGNSLGADTGEFTKDQILLAQDLVNGALVQNGYKQIDTDGKLGPATCGAIQWYQKNVDPQGGASFTGACASVTATPPTKAGGGSAPAPHPATVPVVPMKAGVFGTGGGTNWMLWGGAIAAVAVGGALIFKASKKR